MFVGCNYCRYFTFHFTGIIVIFITVVEKLTTRLITLSKDLSPAILRQKYYVISERRHVCISNFLLSMFQVFMEIEHKCKCVRPKPINSVAAKHNVKKKSCRHYNVKLSYVYAPQPTYWPHCILPNHGQPDIFQTSLLD